MLVTASLVALGQPSTDVVAHDGAANVASDHPAVPTEWSGAGPLAIPTIGVVPPGSEDWFDPKAEPVFRASRGPVPSDPVRLPSTSTIGTDPLPTSGSGGELAISPTAPSSAAASPTATRTEAPSTGARSEVSTPPTTAPQTTAPQTTAPQTTAPQTTAAQTTETTTPETTTPPATTEPTETDPTATDPTPTPTDPTQPTTTEELPATPPQPATNERGNVLLAVGEELTVFDGTTGAAAFAIAVDSVPSDVVCTDPASTSAVNGRLIAVPVHVTTGPDLTAVGGEPTVDAADFRFLGPDGATLTEAGTASAAACLSDTEEFPAGPLAPGQELTGVVVLDVPATAGTLVFAPGFLPVGAEWEYGAPAAG